MLLQTKDVGLQKWTQELTRAIAKCCHAPHGSPNLNVLFAGKRSHHARTVALRVGHNKHGKRFHRPEATTNQ
jgi:hypothetical protein